MAKLHPDLSEFIESLLSQKVDFLLVGAHCLALHGHPRYTGDLDVFIRPTLKNAEYVMAALEAFGFGGLDITVKDLSRPDFVIQLGRPPNRIDILTAIDGCTFDQAWESKIEAHLGGLPVYTLDRETLIENKKASGRPQDIADVETLEKRSR